MKRLLVCAALCFLVSLTRVNGQSSWRKIAQPTTKDLLRLSFIDSSRGWVCGRGGAILKTTDGGLHWSQQDSGVQDDILGIFMLNERIGWAISWVNFTDTNSYYGSRILKTTNGGTTWTSSLFPVSEKYFHSISFFDSLNGWICGVRSDIERTTNGGATWMRAPVDSSFGSGLDMLNMKFVSPQVGYAVGGLMDVAGVVWQTTNRGERWFAKSISPEPIYEIHLVDSLHVIGLTGDLEYGTGIVRTRNGGVTWTYTQLMFFGFPHAMAFRTASEAWGALGNMVMVSRDTALTWQVVDTLGWRQMYDLAFTDSLTGFAVADSGFIYKYEQKTVDVHENNSVFPTFHRLDQNFPNPFNPATTIRFTVGANARGEHVALRVYDLLGNEIATLIDGRKPAGEYRVVWNARSAASGTYFYRLTIGTFVSEKKMLLIK